MQNWNMVFFALKITGKVVVLLRSKIDIFDLINKAKNLTPKTREYLKNSYRFLFIQNFDCEIIAKNTCK